MGGGARHLYVPIVSTQFPERGSSRSRTRFHSADPTELLAVVVRTKREVLLRAHRHRLRRDVLEDCFGQATYELLRSLRGGGGRVVDREHLANVLEQRFLSRVRDELRATRGRSTERTVNEGALAHPVDGGGALAVADELADVEERVLHRIELEQLVRAASRLSTDQRLVLASQLCEIPCADLCRHTGWSAEKYRKVAQRGRARLRELMSEPSAAAPSGTFSESVSRSGAARRNRS